MKTETHDIENMESIKKEIESKAEGKTEEDIIKMLKKWEAK